MRARGYSINIVRIDGRYRFALVQWICDPGETPRKGPVRVFDEYDDAVVAVPDDLEWRDRDPRDAMYVVESWFPAEAEELADCGQ